MMLRQDLWSRYRSYGGFSLWLLSGQSGRLDTDPDLNSLRLLPLGPDRIGEKTVQRQPSVQTIPVLYWRLQARTVADRYLHTEPVGPRTAANTFLPAALQPLSG